ncbi:unnamed protein product [Callosobruchus maculatus]|nr:unnamed protein product [Callosobruchus maculatus]
MSGESENTSTASAEAANSGAHDENVLKIFQSAESSLHFKIPQYIKNLLFLAGFESLALIATMTEKNIEELELYAKEELKSIVPQQDYVKYYGTTYKNYPEKFKFVIGYKKMLHLLIEFCKSQENSVNEENKENMSDTVVKLDNARGIANSEAMPASSNGEKSINSSFDFTEENRTVLRLIKNWTKSRADQSRWIILNSDLDNIIFNTRSSVEKEITSQITCFCKSSCRVPKLNNRWVLSNFFRHLSAKHLNESHEPEKNKNKKITSFLKPTHRPIDRSGPSKINILQNEVIHPITRTSENYISNTALGTNNKDSVYTQNYEIREANTVESDVKYFEEEHSGIVQQLSSAESKVESQPNLQKVRIATSLEVDNDANPKRAKLSKWSTVKYSRTERLRRAREKGHQGQTLLTNFFEIAGHLSTIIQKNPNVTDKIISCVAHHDNWNNFSLDITSFQDYEEKSSFISSFLQRLLENAKGNATQSANNNKYNDITKKISIYLYYVGGRLLYETIYANLKNCVPSISTLNRYLESERHCIQEGDLDLVGLKKHLEERGISKLIWISEDATRIKTKIEYDPKTNKLLGFVLPLKNGLPIKNIFYATSAPFKKFLGRKAKHLMLT